MPRSRPSSTGTVRPNFSTGAYYYNKKLFIGASLPFFLARRYDADQDTWIVTNDASQYQPMMAADASSRWTGTSN